MFCFSRGGNNDTASLSAKLRGDATPNPPHPRFAQGLKVPHVSNWSYHLFLFKKKKKKRFMNKVAVPCDPLPLPSTLRPLIYHVGVQVYLLPIFFVLT